MTLLEILQCVIVNEGSRQTAKNILENILKIKAPENGFDIIKDNLAAVKDGIPEPKFGIKFLQGVNPIFLDFLGFLGFLGFVGFFGFFDFFRIFLGFLCFLGFFRF